jgi:MFS family permease
MGPCAWRPCARRGAAPLAAAPAMTYLSAGLRPLSGRELPLPMSVPSHSLRHDAAVIGLVSGAHCFSHLYIFAIPTALAFLAKDPALAHLDLSFARLGLVFSAFSLASGGFQYLMGVLADRIGAKRVLFGGMTMLATCVTLFGFADSYWQLLLLGFLAGAGNSVFHPVDYAIMGANVSSQRLAPAFSIHTFAGYAGFALGPLTVGLLAELYGWRTAFHAIGVAGLVLTLLVLSQRRRIAGEPPPKAERGRSMADTLGLGLILTPPILLMFLFYVLSGGLSLGLNSAIPPGLHKLWDIPLASAAFAVTAFMFGGAFGTLVGGLIATRTRRLEMVALSGFGASGLVLVFAATVPLPFVLLLATLLLAGFLFGTITPSRDMMVKSITPPGHSGKVFGFVASGFDVGGVIFPPLFGWFIDNGAPAWVFYGAALIMILAFLAAIAATRISRPLPVGAAAE